jgi:hypothetical protein
VNPDIAAVLTQRQFGQGRITVGRSCQGAKFHSPTPLLVYPRLIGERSVWLCGNCMAALQVYEQVALEHGGQVPTSATRAFANWVRDMALGRKYIPGGGRLPTKQEPSAETHNRVWSQAEGRYVWKPK